MSDEERADELDTVAQGYAQLAWAVLPVSTWGAHRLSSVSRRYEDAAFAARLPWAIIAATVSMVGLWAWSPATEP